MQGREVCQDSERGGAARLHVLDPVLSSVRTLTLAQIPAVKNAIDSYPPESIGPPSPDNPNAGSAVIFSSLAGSKGGEVYAKLGSFYVPRGAVVLKMNGDGVLLDTLRCVLPTSEKWKTSGNPDGYLLGAGFVGVTNESVFIAGTAGVVRYRP